MGQKCQKVGSALAIPSGLQWLDFITYDWRWGLKKREKPRPWDTRAIGWKEQSFDFYLMGFPWWLNGKESACIAGDPGSVPGLQRSPGEGNDKPLQYTCLENSMDRRAWWATVHEVTKSQTWLSNWQFHFTFTSFLWEMEVHWWLYTVSVWERKR